VTYRLTKEVAYYKKEVLENEQTLEEMKQDATKDSYDIKRFQAVLNESYMMVPDSTRRLQQTADDLDEFLLEHADNNVIDRTGEWYRTARDFLKDHGAAVTALEKNPNADTKDMPETTTTNVDDLAPDEAF
jgi:hypothetical protein